MAHGYESWELDAIPPNELALIVQDEILSLRSDRQWKIAVRAQEEMRTVIQGYADAAAKRYGQEDTDNA